LAEHPGDAEGRELRMPTSLPDRIEAAESEANENTLQGAVGKTQASKAGLVGSLDAGEGEGPGRCFWSFKRGNYAHTIVSSIA
jgi:hypothetical protein